MSFLPLPFCFLFFQECNSLTKQVRQELTHQPTVETGSSRKDDNNNQAYSMPRRRAYLTLHLSLTVLFFPLPFLIKSLTSDNFQGFHYTTKNSNLPKQNFDRKAAITRLCVSQLMKAACFKRAKGHDANSDASSGTVIKGIT